MAGGMPRSPRPRGTAPTPMAKRSLALYRIPCRSPLSGISWRTPAARFSVPCAAPRSRSARPSVAAPSIRSSSRPRNACNMRGGWGSAQPTTRSAPGRVHSKRVFRGSRNDGSSRRDHLASIEWPGGGTDHQAEARRATDVRPQEAGPPGGTRHRGAVRIVIESESGPKFNAETQSGAAFSLPSRHVAANPAVAGTPTCPERRAELAVRGRRCVVASEVRLVADR